jgi:uncharacterized repeat protein (TIGR03843 family)
VLLGRILRSSNETFLVRISNGADSAQAVYKPEAGERPLSDFEPGLFRRERAAYLLSESLEWGLVPTTVIREDAPLGIGSLQWFVECDFREHCFTLYADAPGTHRFLSRIALFDYVTNNTDRKSGHVLRGDDGRIWGIDHGLCLSAPFKLRTVIWEFAGEVAELLDDAEVVALQRRVRRVLHDGVLPADHTGMRCPWPLV